MDPNALLLIGGFGLLVLTSSRGSRSSTPPAAPSKLLAIRQQLGQPDEQFPHKDKYHFPEGEIVIYYYPPQ